MENAIERKEDYPVTSNSPRNSWAAMVSQLSRYPLVVSTIPLPDVPSVRVVGKGTEGSVLSSSDLSAMRKVFAADIASSAPPQ